MASLDLPVAKETFQAILSFLGNARLLGNVLYFRTFSFHKISILSSINPLGTGILAGRIGRKIAFLYKDHQFSIKHLMYSIKYVNQSRLTESNGPKLVMFIKFSVSTLNKTNSGLSPKSVNKMWYFFI